MDPWSTVVVLEEQDARTHWGPQSSLRDLRGSQEGEGLSPFGGGQPRGGNDATTLMEAEPRDGRSPRAPSERLGSLVVSAGLRSQGAGSRNR